MVSPDDDYHQQFTGAIFVGPHTWEATEAPPFMGPIF